MIFRDFQLEHMSIFRKVSRFNVCFLLLKLSSLKKLNNFSCHKIQFPNLHSSLSPPIKRIAKAEVETEQMQRQIDLTNQANKVKQKHKEIQAIEQPRDENVSRGKDHLETYIANLEAANLIKLNNHLDN